ncbi:MAG: DUF433 domain-containing protein [Desulfobacteraceae bacterium]|nr:DUF433 domain-containing protein [Desulfobacteraceae bacterium]
MHIPKKEKLAVRGTTQYSYYPAFDLNIMGGKPCIRDMRVTVGMIVGLGGGPLVPYWPARRFGL